MQHTLSVLHTLRSSECSTASRKRSEVGVPAGDEPGAARAVQADGRAGLAGDGAELGDRGARTRGRRRAPAARSSNSAQPAARAGDRTRRDGTGRQAGCVERRVEGVGDDRLGRAERVGPDAHHDGVAGAQHAGGVGEHVGPALEHEADHAERRPARLDRPPVVVDAVDRLVAPQVGVAPTAQAARPCRRASSASARAGWSSARQPRPWRRRRRWPRGSGPATSSSARRPANCSKKSLICSSSSSVPARRRRRRRRRPRVRAAAWSAAGTCSRSPVSCTTTRRSPARNAAASSAGTVVTRSPPNTIG